MRPIPATLRLLTALLVAFASAHAVRADELPGVVIQMSDNDVVKWNLALNNARNIQTEYGPDRVQVEIVAYGPGLHMLKFDSEVGPRLADAEKDGVQLRACGNSLKAMKLNPSDLHPSVRVVPAGIVEIMNRQKQGWAYIKP
jgi:intracellular sulfur oxidation DsrE/DsrF family protein